MSKEEVAVQKVTLYRLGSKHRGYIYIKNAKRKDGSTVIPECIIKFADVEDKLVDLYGLPELMYSNTDLKIHLICNDNDVVREDEWFHNVVFWALVELPSGVIGPQIETKVSIKFSSSPSSTEEKS